MTPLAVRELAERAVREANRTYQAGTTRAFRALPTVPRRSSTRCTRSNMISAARARPFTAHPKYSLLSPFFRASGVSGMCAPFFLETLLNPDLTGPERSIVLAHEWAHLSGFNPESDASYVGYLAAFARGRQRIQCVAESGVGVREPLQPVTQQLVLKELAPVRAPMKTIRERLKALVRPVERVAWWTYDQGA